MALLAQANDNTTPLSRLPPDRRAKVYAALAVLLILGAFMIAVTWLSARAVRRYMRRRDRLPPTPPQTRDDDWWRKPLVESPRAPEGQDDADA